MVIINYGHKEPDEKLIAELNALGNTGSIFKTPKFHKKRMIWSYLPFDSRPFLVFLELVKDQNINVFVDLGCGNSCKAIIAKRYFERSIGVEIYGPYFKQAKVLAVSNNTKVELIKSDILSEKLYDIFDEPTVFYSFVPFASEKNDIFVNLCVNKAKPGSIFYFPGLGRHLVGLGLERNVQVFSDWVMKKV